MPTLTVSCRSAVPDASRRVLRPYQVDVLGRLARSDRDVLTEYPTGGGKTLVAIVEASLGLGRRWTHVLVAAPQRQIEQGFVEPGCRSIAWPAGAAAQPELLLPRNFVEAARDGGVGTRRRIRRYLQAESATHVLACTHAALTLLSPDDLPTDLRGALLVVDEAHHAPAEGLARVTALWRARGGRLHFYTATPYRTDGRPVALEGMLHVRRSLAQHMDEGFAPRVLESEIVAVQHGRRRINASQFRGDAAPPTAHHEELARTIAERWVADGRPKTILRVPPGRRPARALIDKIVAALRRMGARTLDASGVGAADQARFVQALEAERRRDVSQSRFDVVVGIMRVMEGAYWLHGAAVYSVGVPGSLTTVVQLVGRALRLKPPVYPATFRDRARAVFFVPLGADTLDRLSVEHSRHALLTCTFLADHRVGQEWVVTRTVRAGLRAGLDVGDGDGTDADTVARDEAEAVAERAIDAQARAEAMLVLTTADEQLRANGASPTLGELVDVARLGRPDLAEAIERVAIEVLATQPGSIGNRARGRLERAVADRVRFDPVVREVMRSAFDAVLEEFRDTTLAPSLVMSEVRRQLHRLTGRDATHFARRLRDAAPPPLTHEVILTWADTHFALTGAWPTKRSGRVADAPGELWGAIDAALSRGHRGLPGGWTLRSLLEAHRPVPPLARPPLSRATILELAKAHNARTGDWPTTASGIVPETGDTWAAIDLAMNRGYRGLEPGGSIARLLEEELGVRNIRNLPPLVDSEILAWVDLHFTRHGEWPTRSKEQIEGAPEGETWMRVISALEQGLRGLARYTSWSAFLREHGRAAETNWELRRKLTIEQVIAYARDFHARTGEWPSATSRDPSLEALGLSWNIIDVALFQGKRVPCTPSRKTLLGSGIPLVDGGRDGSRRALRRSCRAA